MVFITELDEDEQGAAASEGEHVATAAAAEGEKTAAALAEVGSEDGITEREAARNAAEEVEMLMQDVSLLRRACLPAVGTRAISFMQSLIEQNFGVHPNLRSYNMHLKIRCNGREFNLPRENMNRAIQIFKRMEFVGVELNATAYPVAIKVCVKSKDLKLALHLFEEMKVHQLKPNLVGKELITTELECHTTIYANLPPLLIITTHAKERIPLCAIGKLVVPCSIRDISQLMTLGAVAARAARFAATGMRFRVATGIRFAVLYNARGAMTEIRDLNQVQHYDRSAAALASQSNRMKFFLQATATSEHNWHQDIQLGHAPNNAVLLNGKSVQHVGLQCSECMVDDANYNHEQRRGGDRRGSVGWRLIRIMVLLAFFNVLQVIYGQLLQKAFEEKNDQVCPCAREITKRERLLGWYEAGCWLVLLCLFTVIKDLLDKKYGFRSTGSGSLQFWVHALGHALCFGIEHSGKSSLLLSVLAHLASFSIKLIGSAIVAFAFKQDAEFEPPEV